MYDDPTETTSNSCPLKSRRRALCSQSPHRGARHGVGRRDAHTPVLADRLAGLAQQGHDVGRLLATASREGHLPDDHATAALDSRITRIVAEEKRAADASRQRQVAPTPPRMGPDRSGPGIGF